VEEGKLKIHTIFIAAKKEQGFVNTLNSEEQLTQCNV